MNCAEEQHCPGWSTNRERKQMRPREDVSSSRRFGGFLARPPTFAYVEFGDVVWPKLERLTFKDVGPSNPPVETCLISVLNPISFMYDLRNVGYTANCPSESDYELNALDDALGGMYPFTKNKIVPKRSLVNSELAVGEVVLKVKDEGQARQMWGKIQVVWDGNMIREGKQREWAERLVFELVDVGRQVRFVQDANDLEDGPTFSLVEVK